jgi:hypothetical protein
MPGFRHSDQQPPETQRVSDVVVSRFQHILEVDPKLMQEHVPQQDIPNWDFDRIVRSRWEHLAWMHDHWADTVVSGDEIVKEIEAEMVSDEVSEDGTPT